MTRDTDADRRRIGVVVGPGVGGPVAQTQVIERSGRLGWWGDARGTVRGDGAPTIRVPDRGASGRRGRDAGAAWETTVAGRSTPTPSTRVLVLAGDDPWRGALADMYRSVLGRRGDVLTASTDAVAERQLRDRPVDVLSLDLDLSEASAGGEGPAGGGGRGPLLCDAGRLRLIEAAARHRWAGAVVLVIRPDAGGRARFVACDVDKLDEATVSPDEFVRRRFGERGLVLNKPDRWDLPASVARFEAVIRRRLPDLARPSYTLRFGGTRYDPRVTIEAGRHTVAALEGADAMLLAVLVIAGRAGEMLSDRSVLEVYRGRAAAGEAGADEVTRLAQREVDGFRRRLRRQGVNDRALVRRVRKAASGDRPAAGGGIGVVVGADVAKGAGAWRLDGAVVAEGMSPLNVRARGGGGLPDVADREPADLDADG